MGLRDIESSLPPGFRFHPSDEELVCHYLYKKVSNEEVDKSTFMEINLHTCEPWQLPEGTKLNSNESYFFSFRDRKYATGSRANRAATTGYWKATGKDRFVYSPTTHMVVGMRKTLVFYQNRAPNGIKTDWIMHEFRLENPHTPPKEDWVLCRVFQKGTGENNYQLSPQNEFRSSTSPPTNPTFPCNYQSQISSILQDSLAANPNFLPVSGQRIDAPVDAMNSTHDDECDFFFDMDFEERNIGDVVPKNFGEIISYGDDNSMVFH